MKKGRGISRFKRQKTLQSSDNDREQINLRLPEHLVLSSLARVPLSNYQSMSQVCRTWRRMLKQEQFWKARQDQNATKIVMKEIVFLCVLGTDLNRKVQCRKKVVVWRAFSPLSNTWFQVPATPEDGRVPGSSACATLNGKLFVIGGKLEDSGLSCTTVSYFDIGQNCWRVAASLNIPRSNCKAGVIANELYAFGGFTESSPAAEGLQEARVFLQTAEVYDAVADSWRLVSNIRIPAQIDYSIVLDEKLFAIGTSGKDVRTLKSCKDDWTRFAHVMGAVYYPQKNEWIRMARGLMQDWPIKTVELNGRLYGAHHWHSLDFYNSREGCWQPVELTWERRHFADFSEEVASRFFSAYCGWRVELLNLGGKLCMIGLRHSRQHVMAAVLDMQEHLSTTNEITIQANVVVVEDITSKIRDSESGFLPRLENFLLSQAI